MNDLLISIKADLLDRRLLPAVALVGLCLAGALAYALMGGGSPAPAPLAAPVAPTAPVAGLAVSASTPETAVAETTDGFKQQQYGVAHNPFTLLPGSATTAATSRAVSTATATSSTSSSTTSSSSGSTSSGSKSSGSSGGSSGGTTEKSKSSTETTPTAKKVLVYHVTLEFGVVPPGAPPKVTPLTAYPNVKLQTPIPSAKQPLLVFRGVTLSGKSATFTLVGEGVLHGVGACLPSAEQCKALDLRSGATEQLEYLQSNGETIVYELRVVSIVASTASAAASAAEAKTAGVWGESTAGLALLAKAHLSKIPYLRYSSQPGVLVFSPQRAHSARAHIALLRGR